MSQRRWVRLDNASNIFLAARSEADPKVFRLSAELDHDVDPALLQDALDATFERYPLYHVVLRSGVFWYYLQDSDLRPVVTADTMPTCAPIYQPDRRRLLFRVAHHRSRVVLEVFHALSDGTGALWFLTDVVEEYLRRRHPEDGSLGPAPDAAVGPGLELVADSFAHYFRGRPRIPSAGSRRARRIPARTVHRIPGTRTPDRRPRVVELSLPAADALGLARAHGVTLTAYLTALFFESVRATSGGLGPRRTVTASVPVNLRQFFPSTSARNFFATIRVAHTFGEGEDLGALCRDLDAQFRDKITPEALERKLARLTRLERTPALRILPRVLKDAVLGMVNRVNNRGLSVAVSNLGRVTLPGISQTRVRRMFLHVSAVRPQFCALSHGETLTVSFTSPFIETDHVRHFARLLSAEGVEVSVAATRVSAAELEAGRA